MCNKQLLSNVALLSNRGTSANETGTKFFNTLSGNPYEDFARLGIDLQDVTLRFLAKPRKNGVAITGVFNICGIYYTSGAADYPSLLDDVLQRYHEKCAWHKRSQEEKKLRYIRGFINRYPDATVLPAWLS